MIPLLRDTYVEINLDNIAYNMRKIKATVGDKVAIAAVVKANGYGSGRCLVCLYSRSSLKISTCTS